MKSEEKIQYSCRRIKIPASDEKCVDDNGQVNDTTARRKLKKCFVTCVISICVINYAILVKNAL